MVVLKTRDQRPELGLWFQIKVEPRLDLGFVCLLACFKFSLLGPSFFNTLTLSPHDCLRIVFSIPGKLWKPTLRKGFCAEY